MSELGFKIKRISLLTLVFPNIIPSNNLLIYPTLYQIQYQSNQVLSHSHSMPHLILSNPNSFNITPSKLSTMTHIEYTDLIPLAFDSEERRNVTSVHIPATVTQIGTLALHMVRMMNMVSRTAQL